MRLAAVKAVVEINDDESRAILRKRFPREREPQVRAAIARAFGEMADRTAVDLLTAALFDSHTDEAVRGAVLDAVEMIGSKQAVQALVRLLARKGLTAPVAARVATVLGRLKDRAAVAPLMSLARSDSPQVQAAALFALASIVKAKEIPEPVREEARRTARKLLDDTSAEVRTGAIAAAATLDDRQAIPALIALSERPDWRFEAATALAALPDLRHSRFICED